MEESYWGRCDLSTFSKTHMIMVLISVAVRCVFSRSVETPFSDKLFWECGQFAFIISRLRDSSESLVKIVSHPCPYIPPCTEEWRPTGHSFISCFALHKRYHGISDWGDLGGGGRRGNPGRGQAASPDRTMDVQYEKQWVTLPSALGCDQTIKPLHDMT